MKDLILKAKNKHDLSFDEIVSLLEYKNADEIFIAANEIREKYVGNDVHIRGLIEFSNICKQNCKYCGIRAKNNHVERYRLSENGIIQTVSEATNLGYKTIVLQSGEDDYFDEKKMISLIKKIKKYDVALTLSIGEKTHENYKAYKMAGADRYLLRIETTDKTLYKKMHPNMSFENRKLCLYNLKNLGFETGSGCLVGLPEQSIESLACDILFFKELEADMIGIGPFIATKKTPLEMFQNGDIFLSFKVMAIVRLLMPDINIPATTAMETLLENGRKIALQSGANVVMINITPQIYRLRYNIYDNKNFANVSLSEIKKLLSSLNRTVALDFGSHKS